MSPIPLRKEIAPPLDQRSLDLRRAIIGVLGAAGRGHVGPSFSLVEIMRVLYDEVLRYDPARPDWPQRDRCILSKGHGCLALYVMLAEKGFFPAEELGRFCAIDGILGGHPERSKVPGVEASTGSLGHGLSLGIGMALAARQKKQDHRVMVIVGDGECDEGSVWEAAMCAGKHCLDNLVLLVDYNKHQSWGSTHEVQDLEPFGDKWRAFGWEVAEVNGHNLHELRSVLHHLPLKAGKPNAVICHTIKGRGVDFVENNLEWHHKSKIDQQMVQTLLDGLGGF